MKYYIKASSSSKNNGSIDNKQTQINFGTTPESADILANPAEIFLASFSACILKNIERFSILTNFEYSNAEIKVNATRKEKPSRMDEINYEVIIYSQDSKLNINLLKKYIEKFGTIFSTVMSSCSFISQVKIILMNYLLFNSRINSNLYKQLVKSNF